MVDSQPIPSLPQPSLVSGLHGHSSNVVPYDVSRQVLPSSSSPLTGTVLSLTEANCSRVFALPIVVSNPNYVNVCSFSNFDVSLIPEDFGEHRNIWKLCLIGYSIGKTPSYTILGKFIENVWKCSATLHIHDSGWLVFHFSSVADMSRVVRRGPYSVQGKPLVIKPMPSFFFAKPDISSMPVWVCLPNLSMECWSPACLSKISNVIGKYIRCDVLTLSMSRVSCAQVMIEVNLSAELP